MGLNPGKRPDPQLGVVAEAFLDRSLSDLLDWLSREAPEVSALELGSGGYAPHPHCDRQRILHDGATRDRWLREIESRGLTVGALNVWGNPLHPDENIANRHDRDLRETIQLAAELEVNRVIALAGCPGASPTDAVPHFAAGGWLPYLEDVWEMQWERYAAPYWVSISEFARREHPDLKICLELHPGTMTFNVETFSHLADLGENLAANVDPSHFFWQRMDPVAVVEALGDRAAYVHAKDVSFNQSVLATEGLLDRRWPGPTSQMPWKFDTVGRGHPAEWWSDFLCSLEGTQVTHVAIEHEDPDVPPEDGVPEAARLLAAVGVTV